MADSKEYCDYAVTYKMLSGAIYSGQWGSEALEPPRTDHRHWYLMQCEPMLSGGGAMMLVATWQRFE